MVLMDSLQIAKLLPASLSHPGVISQQLITFLPKVLTKDLASPSPSTIPMPLSVHLPPTPEILQIILMPISISLMAPMHFLPIVAL